MSLSHWKIGNVTEPISTASGYYIIRVTEKSDNMSIPEEFSDILVNGEFENWLQEQRDASIIEDFLDQDKINWAIDHI